MLERSVWGGQPRKATTTSDVGASHMTLVSLPNPSSRCAIGSLRTLARGFQNETIQYVPHDVLGRALRVPVSFG